MPDTTWEQYDTGKVDGLAGGDRWYRYHERVFEREGAVLDLGCYQWDWSKKFVGEKEVVGVDPLEEKCPEGCKLIQAVVGIADGTTVIYGADSPLITSVFRRGGETRCVRMVSLDTLLKLTGKVALLKMNIEGSEFPLIMSMTEPVADQMAIAFHCRDRKEDPFSIRTMEACIWYLMQWYEPILTDRQHWWWLFLRK